MGRFIGNWEVESDMVVPDGTPFVRYDHPASTYTVFLRNISDTRNDDLTFISMQVVFDAPALFEAKEIGEKLAKEFLDYLAFTTNLKVRLRTLLQIYSWEQGSGMREGLIWTRARAHDDAPYPVLDDLILKTIGLLQSQEAAPRLRRALKWFSNGIAARSPDDQFAYFWFVIELVAQIVKQTAPVPDKCPKCKTPLYCETCGTSPLHRPYPKQAIDQLFSKYVNDEPEVAYQRSNDARNMLMHGEEVTSIERELGIEFTDLVNQLGQFAWVALLNQFVPVLLNKQPSFLQTNQYVRMDFRGMAHITTAFMPNFDNPDPAHFPNFKFTLIEGDQSAQPNGPVPPLVEDGPNPQNS
jgi:hypothetical protein